MSSPRWPITCTASTTVQVSARRSPGPKCAGNCGCPLVSSWSWHWASYPPPSRSGHIRWTRGGRWCLYRRLLFMQRATWFERRLSEPACIAGAIVSGAELFEHGLQAPTCRDRGSGLQPAITCRLTSMVSEMLRRKSSLWDAEVLVRLRLQTQRPEIDNVEVLIGRSAHCAPGLLRCARTAGIGPLCAVYSHRPG